MTAAPLDADLTRLLAHDGLLRALIRDLVRDQPSADDVLQDTWITALERPPRAHGALRGWLVRVARNRARQVGRGESRLAQRERRAAKAEAVPSTADIVEREARRREVRELVLELDEPYRTVLALRYFEGLRPTEIAGQRNVPAATVRTQLHRGLERLRRRLDQDHGDDRRAWIAAFAPLATPDSGSQQPVVPPPTNAAAWWRPSTGWSTALVMVALIATVYLGAFDPDPPRPGSQTEQATSDPPASGTTQRTARRRPTDASTSENDTQAIPPSDSERSPDSAPASPSYAVEVTDARSGDRLPGAEIALLRLPFNRPGRELSRTVSNADGPTSVPANQLATHLRVRLRGRQTVVRELLEHKGAVHIALEPGVPIRGRVILSGTDTGVAGVRIFAADEQTQARFDRVVRTDAGGRFELSGVRPNWRFSITARHPGFGDVTHIDCRSTTGPEVVLVLGDGATLSVRVTDEQGAGVSGAQVSVLAQSHSELELSRSSRSSETQATRSGTLTTTDEDGRYVVRGLAAPGSYVVAARTQRHLWARSQPVEIAEVRGAARCDVSLGAAVASLVVRVTGPTGEAVPGADVDVYRLEKRPRRVVRAQFVEEDGTLNLLLEPAEEGYEVHAGAPGYAAVVVTTRVPCSDPLELQLGAGSVITGTVSDPDGRPIPGATVSYSASARRSKSTQRVRTAEDGTFRLPGIPDAAGGIRISHGEHLREIVKSVQAADSPLAITLQPAPRFIGRFVPVPAVAAANPGRVNVRVYRSFGGSSATDLSLDADGRFTFPVRARVGEVVHLAFRVPGAPPILLSDRKLAAGGPIDLGPLTLGEGRPLAGSVKDPDGRGLAGVRVSASWDLGEPDQRPFHGDTTFTDATGRFEFPGAPDRLRGVWYSLPGWVVARETDQKATDVRMVRAGSVTGRLIPPPETPRFRYPFVRAHPLNDDGEPVGEAVLLEFTDREDAEVTARGHFRGWLLPGRYRLVIGRNAEPWQKALERTIAVRSGATEHVRLAFE